MQSFGTPTSYLALFMLIPLTAYVVWAKRAQNAVLAVAFTAFLFGPEASFWKLPAIPPLDKLSLPYILLFGVALWKWRSRLRKAKPLRGADWLIIMAMIGAFVTASNNEDPLQYGSWRVTRLPALRINDAIQFALRQLFEAAFPFMLGRALFRNRRDLFELLRFLVVAALVQTLFIFVELRLSPQFHTWIYGYGAHSDFLQTIRWGGYRPMVFTAHGLALGLFMCIAFLASVLLLQARVPKITRFKSKRVMWYLGVVLVLCKSTGAIAYGILFGILLWKVSPKAQMRFAVGIAVFVLAYPMLRAADAIPVEDAVQLANDTFGAERAQSLSFRFENEEILMDKARERIWFGWGGQGRRSVYDDYEGKEIAVADGFWIITLGMRGIIGFLQSFGLLLIPILALWRVLPKVRDPADRRLLAGYGLILAVAVFDLIPNGLFSNYPYLLAGALMGFVQEIKTRPRNWAPAYQPPPGRRPAHTF